MKRFLATIALMTLLCLALTTADVWACPPPPDNLPQGTGVLPGPNQVMMLGPSLQVRPYEKHRPGPITLNTRSSGGNQMKATPIQLPGPRSVRTWNYGTSNRISKPNTLPHPPLLRLPPRPMATPMPLP
jgi:hypothetical protein